MHGSTQGKRALRGQLLVERSLRGLEPAGDDERFTREGEREPALASPATG